MPSSLLTLTLQGSQADIVVSRRSARSIAELLGFTTQDQIRIATAVSEVARSSQQAQLQFSFDRMAQQAMLIVEFSDVPISPERIGDILKGHFDDADSTADGILNARRLVDGFEVHEGASPLTSRLVLIQHLPPHITPPPRARFAEIENELNRTDHNSTLDELKQQNQELAVALNDIRARETEMVLLNRELQETNRGVMALTAELEERAGYAKRSSDLKSSFLSNMSHEFRTPLSSILSLTRILLDRMDGDLSSEQEKQVQLIRNSAQSLAELVNDLLDLAKIEAGKTTVRPAEFAVSDFLGAIRGVFRPIVMDDAVELIIEDSIELGSLYTDEAKVAQIIRNLISNALKFTIEGEVRVTSRELDDDMIVIEVRDTGIGIEPRNHELIFDEFIQVEGFSVKTKGTGLGLPLSRKLARLLGGDLTVDSEIGCGSTFALTLPRIYKEFAVAESGSAPENLGQ